MESGTEALILRRAQAWARERHEADLEDLPEDLQDELLEEAEAAIEGERDDDAYDRDVESRLGREDARSYPNLEEEHHG